MHTDRSRRYRPPQAAQYLDVSESFLAKKRMSGGGPAYSKIAGAIIYDEPDLDAYRAACRIEPRQNFKAQAIITRDSDDA